MRFLCISWIVWHILVGKQEHGGNLNEAVNAHYGDVGRHMYGISV